MRWVWGSLTQSTTSLSFMMGTHPLLPLCPTSSFLCPKLTWVCHNFFLEDASRGLKLNLAVQSWSLLEGRSLSPSIGRYRITVVLSGPGQQLLVFHQCLWHCLYAQSGHSLPALRVEFVLLLAQSSPWSSLSRAGSSAVSQTSVPEIHSLPD